MENGFLRVEIDTRSGLLSRILDVRSGHEVLSGPGAAAVVIDESKYDTWAHNASSFREEVGRFTATGVRVMDAGPVLSRLRVTGSFGSSSLRQDFILRAGSAVLEVNARLTWLEKQRMLKIAFPAHLRDPVATWETPYGFSERPANGEEESGQQWIDVTGRAEGGAMRGLSLLNSGKYSFDILGAEMRMTVARSPVAADNGGIRDADCEYLDQGIQDFRYALLPHDGGWRESGVVRAAYELNCPPFRVLETYHPGPLPRTVEGVRVTSPSVIVTAFKRAEDGGAYILRCHDSGGEGARATIELPPLSRSWTVTFRPFEIRTFRIPDDPDHPVVETSLIELKEDDRAL